MKCYYIPLRNGDVWIKILPDSASSDPLLHLEEVIIDLAEQLGIRPIDFIPEEDYK